MKNLYVFLILGVVYSFTVQATEKICPRYEADIPLSSFDPRLGFTGNDMIGDFNNASQSALFVWEDGAETSAHWEFSPDSDSANISIIDYDDDGNCDSNVSWLSVKGVLSLKTKDGRINARWHTLLSSLLGGLDSVRINSELEPQELQGLPQPTEEEYETTYIWMGVRDGQLDGAIFRSYLKGDDYFRGLAFIGGGLDIPSIIWEKP